MIGNSVLQYRGVDICITDRYGSVVKAIYSFENPTVEDYEIIDLWTVHLNEIRSVAERNYRSDSYKFYAALEAFA